MNNVDAGPGSSGVTAWSRCTPSFIQVRRALLATSALVSVVFSGQTAIAQEDATGEDAEATDTRELETVVVTGQSVFFRPTEASSATKFPLDIVDTPQAISVVTDDVLDDTFIEDIVDIDKYVAGLTPGQPQQSLLPTVFARGFSIDLDNGYKLNGFSTFGGFQPDPIALERAEVVKGPSSIVYGVNNYGGTINYVTKQPLKEFENAVSASYGSFDNIRITGDTTGPLTQDGSVAYRLTAAYQDRDFVQDGASLERISITPTITWDITPNASVGALVFFQEEDVVFDRGFTAIADEDGLPSVDFSVDEDLFFGIPEFNLSQRDHLQFVLTGKYEFSDNLRIEGQTGYTETTTDGRAVYTYNFFNPIDPVTQPVNVYAQNFINGFESTDAEVRFSGEFELFGREHKFLANGEYREIVRDRPFYAYRFLGTTSQVDPDLSFIDVNDLASFAPAQNGEDIETRERYSIGGQILFSLTDKLSLLAGGRFSAEDVVVESRVTFTGGLDDNIQPFETQFDEDFDQFTPRVALTYAVTDETNFYYSFSEGFLPQDSIRAGEDVVSAAGIVNTLPGGIVDPEEGTQHEVGFKAELFEQALGINIAAFLIERDNVAQQDPNNGQILDEVTGEVIGNENFFVNTGDGQEHRGIELETLGRLNDNVNIIFTYAYLEAESAENQEVGNAPRHSINLLGQYEFTEGALEGLSLSAGYNFIDNTRTALLFQPRSSFEERQTFDVFASYAVNESLSINAAVTNLTDQREIFAFGNRNFLRESDPREFRIRVDYGF
ncbi:MAG: TonB-dependent siderophore receptor [Pseudomonadota bacterium]